MQKAQSDRWLTTKEVSEYLSISRQTLMLWIEMRNFPAVKVGKFWRYRQDEIDRWMRESSEHRPDKGVTPC